MMFKPRSSQKVPSDTVESGGYPFGPGSHTAEALEAGEASLASGPQKHGVETDFEMVFEMEGNILGVSRPQLLVER